GREAHADRDGLWQLLLRAAGCAGGHSFRAPRLSQRIHLLLRADHPHLLPADPAWHEHGQGRAAERHRCALDGEFRPRRAVGLRLAVDHEALGCACVPARARTRKDVIEFERYLELSRTEAERCGSSIASATGPFSRRTSFASSRWWDSTW